jgi:hypothetical protein
VLVGALSCVALVPVKPFYPCPVDHNCILPKYTSESAECKRDGNI